MAILESHNFNSLSVSSTKGNNVIQQKQTQLLSNVDIVTGFGRRNNTSMRIILDYNLGLYNNNWRSEARWDANRTLYEGWYAFSLFIPSDYVMTAITETIHQLHGGTGGSFSPAFSLRLGLTDLLIRHNTGNALIPGSQVLTTFNAGAITKGVWNDICYKIRLFPDSTGYIKFWLNRVLIYNYSGPLHFLNALTAPTSYKIGIYDSTRAGTPVPPIEVNSRTLNYDEFRVADAVDGDWETFIALHPDNLPALSGIDSPVIPPDPVSFKFFARIIEPIV